MATSATKKSISKGWFLTYPKCPISKEDALTILRTNFKQEIVEYVVSEEKHEDGEPHLHAFIKFDKKVKFSKKFDLLEYHGHYESAKSWRAVQKYCMKDGNYISNLNLEAAEKKQSKKLLPEDFERDPIDLMNEGKLAPLSLNNFLKNRSTYLGLKRSHDYTGEKKCYWIWGKSGIGKSYSIRHIYKDIYCKPQNKWWDGYAGEENVLLDDLDTNVIGHYLKIWADQYPFNAEIKGATIRPTYKRFFVTSNYQIKDLYIDLNMVEAIERRFKVVHADDYLDEQGYFDFELYLD